MLKRCVFDKISVKRPDVLVHAKIGEDCSVLEFGDLCCAMSTDPITGAEHGAGRLAVHVNCNDIASSGVKPVGILVTILAPQSAVLEDIENIMDEINSAASSIDVEILGGHTEITDAVNRMVISVTAIGKGPISAYVTTSGAESGDSIVVSKYAGLEGTSIIARDYNDYLKQRLDAKIIDRARDFADMISVVKEGIIAQGMGVKCMHDATEGGLLGALWEVAEASGKGFIIYEDKIPVAYETKKICEVMNINPLRLISSGMMIMTSKNGEALVESLMKQGINASIIGKITEDKKHRVIVRNGASEQVAPPENDELFNIKLN